MPDFTRAVPVPRPLDVRWIHGSPSAKHDTGPEIQVHAYDEHTVVLRQNKAVHYEAPFLYLLFGAERAVLLDTGATADAAHFPLRAVVDEQIGAWLARHPRDGYGLLVLHTHPHGDHVAGGGAGGAPPPPARGGAPPPRANHGHGVSHPHARAVTREQWGC
ncbi:hypothetical protein ACFV4F_05110, partial [Kitasatospora sp. NPDC059722]